MSDTVTLGNSLGTKLPIMLSAKSREVSLYVIGTPGTGKSTLLGQIARQDMDNGHGVCVIDPHGSLAEDILSYVPGKREGDVIYWRPSDIARPFGFNPLACDPTDVVLASRRVQSFVAALESLKEFQDVFAQGTRMKDMLFQLGHAFVSNQGHSLLEMADFIAVDPEDKLDRAPLFRREFYQQLEEYNPEVREFWRLYDKLPLNDKRDRSESTANKLRRFRIDPIMSGIFGQATNSIDFSSVVDDAKILIIDLTDIGRYDAAFIGAFVVWELWQAAQSGLGQKRPRPFHILCDEFENYMTLAFPEIQKQGRKFRFDAVVAHQERSGLGIEIAGSTLSLKNRVVFSISGKDALDLAREFRKDVPEGQTRQQQKFALVTNILKHLEQSGHEETTVLEKRDALIQEFERVFSYALANTREDERIALALRTIENATQAPTAPYALRASGARQQLEAMCNAVLYSMMAAESEGDAIKLWEEDGANRTRFVQSVDDLYGQFFSHVDRTTLARKRALERTVLTEEPRTSSGDAKDFIWHRTQLLWECEQAIERLLFQLGLKLFNDKCYVHSGQLETVVSNPRTYSDVEAEIANTLSQLPMHTALVSIIENGRPAMYTIATIKTERSEDEETEAKARAERIKAHSRNQYGHDGAAVRSQLRARLYRNRAVDESEEAAQSVYGVQNAIKVEQVRSVAAPIDDEEGIILRD